MNFAQFQTVLQRTDPAKLYLFAGPEIYWHQKGRQELLDRFIPPEVREFNYAKFGDSVGDQQRGFSLALTTPLGCAYRMVVMKGPGLTQAETIRRVESYCAAASSKSILILEIEKWEKGNRLERLVSENGILVECSAVSPAEKKQWLQEYSKSNGYTLDFTAVSLAADRAGNSLQEMACQMDKLFAWEGDSNRISAKDVEMVLSSNRDVPFWELSNALSEGNMVKAMSTVNFLLQEGEVPLVLLAVITRPIRNWITAQEMLRESASEEAIGRKLKIPAFKLSAFMRLIRRLSPDGLRLLYAAAARVDDQMKSTAVPPRIYLEKLIIQAINLVKRANVASR